MLLFKRDFRSNFCSRGQLFFFFFRCSLFSISWVYTGAKRLYVPDGTQNQHGRRRKRLVCKHPWFSLLIALFILYACWCILLYRSKLTYNIIFICLLVVSLILQRDDLCIGYTYHVQIKSAVIRTIYTGYTYHSSF